MATKATVMTAVPEQVKQAQRVLEASAGDGAFYTSTPDGLRPLPPEIGAVVASVVEAMAAGRTVTVESLPARLTTTQAARLLDESRPTLMKRIASGELPSTMVGSHHRVETDDVLELRRSLMEERRAAVFEPMDLEDDLGLR